MYLPSTVLSINLLYLFSLFALTPHTTHARTLHRWDSLDLVSHDHVHSHSHSHTHAHHDFAIQIINTNTINDSESHDADPFNPSDSSPPSAAAAAAVIEEAEDDWQKYDHEQTEQRDMRRKLECRSVEFGRCDVKRRALRVRTVTLPVNVPVGEVGGEVEGKGKEEQEGDEFVGRRLPRGLQVWLAREGGGGR